MGEPPGGQDATRSERLDGEPVSRGSRPPGQHTIRRLRRPDPGAGIFSRAGRGVDVAGHLAGVEDEAVAAHVQGERPLDGELQVHARRCGRGSRQRGPRPAASSRGRGGGPTRTRSRRGRRGSTGGVRRPPGGGAHPLVTARDLDPLLRRVGGIRDGQDAQGSAPPRARPVRAATHRSSGERAAARSHRSSSSKTVVSVPSARRTRPRPRPRSTRSSLPPERKSATAQPLRGHLPPRRLAGGRHDGHPLARRAASARPGGSRRG